jgi:Domain of unknown function (DUF4430)
MKHKKLLAGCGVLFALVVGLASTALAGEPTVTVRVEGIGKTLLAPTKVMVHPGSITRFGAPKGECSDESAQGALDIATHHRWVGKWSTEFGPEYEITSILGEAHSFSSKYFWEIYVNNVPATAGACELKLHAGEQLLFAAVSSKTSASPRPLVIQDYPKHATVGKAFGLRVFAYTDKGKTVRVKGATVAGDGVHATTNQFAVASITPTKPGNLVLRATKDGFVRSAPITVHIS